MRAGEEVLESKCSRRELLDRSTRASKPDCLRVEVLAQIRIAREHDAAQERGEVAVRADSLRRGSDVRAADIGPPANDELGLDRRRLAEWRDMAGAGEGT
jgi:hypothetical protein